MKKIEHIIKVFRQLQPELEASYNIKKLGIFGSYIRAEEKTKSDLDVLVDFSHPISLLRYVHLQSYLSGIFGMKVDLVMQSALKPHIGAEILKEVQYIYG